MSLCIHVPVFPRTPGTSGGAQGPAAGGRVASGGKRLPRGRWSRRPCGAREAAVSGPGRQSANTRPQGLREAARQIQDGATRLSAQGPGRASRGGTGPPYRLTSRNRQAELFNMDSSIKKCFKNSRFTLDGAAGALVLPAAPLRLPWCFWSNF